MTSRSKAFQGEGHFASPETHAPPGFLPWVAALVHMHRSRLLAYARRRGLDAEESLDVVQDSFISFLLLPEARAIAEVDEDALKLLTVMVRHNLQNRRRKRARHTRAHLMLEQAETTKSESSEDLILRAEELARVNGCILRMAKLQRSVVMLSLLDEQPRDEVARILGISDGYVRVLLHRAREHIRTCSYVYDDVPTPAS